MLKRISFFSYGVINYALFLGVFLYAIGFVGNIFVPVAIDGVPQVSFWQAFVVDSVLLGIFALQHSVMARPGFKKWWTRAIPKPVERSTYVLFSNIAMVALFVFWEPMGGVVWNITEPAGQAVMWGVFATGWLLVLVSTFLINHFDLFGLRQVWLFLIGKPYSNLPFHTPAFYKLVRHPLYVGWFLALWATPTMTVTHLVFAIATAAYILIAIQLEERDLMDAHPEYRAYREQVPMLIPRFTGGRVNRKTADQAA